MDHFQYLLLMAGCLALTAPLELLGARVYGQLARLACDALAIAAGVWTYNPRYVTGLRLPLLRVPVEELLFFLVVPVCAILTYGCVQALLGRRQDWRQSR
jgi:lycopene cyclase domain-containing protein